MFLALTRRIIRTNLFAFKRSAHVPKVSPAKHEVDIVLERGNSAIIGIEIKASATVRVEDFKALAKLAEFAGNKLESGILFYTGSNILPFKYNDITFHAIPISLFLDKP